MDFVWDQFKLSIGSHNEMQSHGRLHIFSLLQWTKCISKHTTILHSQGWTYIRIKKKEKYTSKTQNISTIL